MLSKEDYKKRDRDIKDWVGEIYKNFLSDKGRYLTRFSAIVLLQSLPDLLLLKGIKEKREKEKLDLITKLFNSIDTLERPSYNPQKNNIPIEQFLKDFEKEVSQNQPFKDLLDVPVVQINTNLDDGFVYVDDKLQNNDNLLSSFFINPQEQQGFLQSVMLVKPTFERRFNVTKVEFMKPVEYILSFSGKSLVLMTTSNVVKSMYFYSLIEKFTPHFKKHSFKISFRGGDNIFFNCQSLKEIISISKLILSVIE